MQGWRTYERFSKKLLCGEDGEKKAKTLNTIVPGKYERTAHTQKSRWQEESL